MIEFNKGAVFQKCDRVSANRQWIMQQWIALPSPGDLKGESSYTNLEKVDKERVEGEDGLTRTVVFIEVICSQFRMTSQGSDSR